MEIIRSIKYVDEVVPQENMDKLAAVQRYHADVVFVGSDWKGTAQWKAYEQAFRRAGGGISGLFETY